MKCEQVFDECAQRGKFRRCHQAKITVMTPFFLTSVLLFALTYTCRAQVDTSDFTRCRSTSECPSNHCCVIAPMRYSVPQCRLMQKQGEICRRGDSTLSTTLSYPDGTSLTIEDVHYVICPCDTGLTCDRNGTCEVLDTNQVFGENIKQND